MTFPRITTRDILAVMIVGACLVFNGLTLSTGRPLDPTTIGFAGIVVGYYFRGSEASAPVEDAPLAPPATGE